MECIKNKWLWYFILILLFILIRHEKNIDNEKERITKELGEEEIAAKKAKEEQLWASFKKDTGTMPQKSSKPAASQIVRNEQKSTQSMVTFCIVFETPHCNIFNIYLWFKFIFGLKFFKPAWF